MVSSETARSMLPVKLKVSSSEPAPETSSQALTIRSVRGVDVNVEFTGQGPTAKVKNVNTTAARAEKRGCVPESGANEKSEFFSVLPISSAAAFR